MTEVLSILGVAFDKEITKPLVKVYMLDLGRCRKERIEEAAEYIRTHNKYFPRIADFVEYLERTRPVPVHPQVKKARELSMAADIAAGKKIITD